MQLSSQARLAVICTTHVSCIGFVQSHILTRGIGVSAGVCASDAVYGEEAGIAMGALPVAPFVDAQPCSPEEIHFMLIAIIGARRRTESTWRSGSLRFIVMLEMVNSRR